MCPRTKKFQRKAKLIIREHCLVGCANCKDFLEKSPAERNNFVSDNKLSFSCLFKGHQLNDCKSDFRCRKDSCDHQ